MHGEWLLMLPCFEVPRASVHARAMLRFTRATLPLAAFLALAAAARAQETVFNVPSPDVLDRGKWYFETDQYFRPWDTQSGTAAFFFVRGVTGLGSDIEVGVNAGPFDYLHASSPFLDAAVKWRPVTVEYGSADGDKGSYGFFFGDHLGVGVHGVVEGDVHDYVYGAAYVVLPETKTRFSAGPYYATEKFFAPEGRFGAQLTGEQPIPAVDGLTLAADWFSGDGAAATVGVALARGPLTLYAAYGFANQGRADDLVALELGYSF
jgi:hypothetical protein